MKTDYICLDRMKELLSALMPDNRDALMISMYTGLRISDVLRLRWERCSSLRPGQLLSLTVMKTGKSVNVMISPPVYDVLKRRGAGVLQKGWVFPGRTRGTSSADVGANSSMPRTRQAVWKDLKRCARLYRCDGKKLRENLGPHSCRKLFAVSLYRETKSLEVVRRALGHSDLAVTLLYAMADELTARDRSVSPRESELTLVGK